MVIELGQRAIGLGVSVLVPQLPLPSHSFACLESCTLNLSVACKRNGNRAGVNKAGTPVLPSGLNFECRELTDK